MMQPDLLKARDLADRLGVSVPRVYQLIAAGEIPSVRVGNAIRIPRPAWERWLAGKADQAEAAASTSGPRHK
jgi:excisionase family DNA binding protein